MVLNMFLILHKYEKKCFIFEFDLDLCFEILVLKKQEIL